MTPLLHLATYSPSLADPSGASALVPAVGWIEGTLLGPIATTIALIAVAGVGFLALAGRVPIRRALTVIGGCFVLFGASSIVAGIESAVRAEGRGEAPLQHKTAERSPLNDLPKTPAVYDPYAGAAVPSL